MYMHTIMKANFADLTTPSVNPAKMVVAEESTVTGAQMRLDPPDVY